MAQKHITEILIGALRQAAVWIKLVVMSIYQHVKAASWKRQAVYGVLAVFVFIIYMSHAEQARKKRELAEWGATQQAERKACDKDPQCVARRDASLKDSEAFLKRMVDLNRSQDSQNLNKPAAVSSGSTNVPVGDSSGRRTAAWVAASAMCDRKKIKCSIDVKDETKKGDNAWTILVVVHTKSLNGLADFEMKHVDVSYVDGTWQSVELW